MDDIKDIKEEYYDNGGYQGQMKDGKKEGKEIYIWEEDPRKDDVYEWEWKDDKMHGKGLYLFCSGKEKIYKIYTGDWYNGKMHGKGLMKYTDGYYEGDWVNDKREGKGKF